MRPFPVNTAATFTALEIVVTLERTTGNQILGLLFRNRLQDAVTGHASREWAHGTAQLKPLGYFGELAPAIGFPHPISMCYAAAFEQIAITRQQDAVFGRRDLC